MVILSSGENSHLLLSILVKHLDHKSVAIQPSLQVDIVIMSQHDLDKAQCSEPQLLSLVQYLT
jgi:hypothetical protein